jgi:hypothetical protein
MEPLRELLRVEPTTEGMIAVTVERTYDDGIGYRARLRLSPDEARALSGALDRFAKARVDQSVSAPCSVLRVFELPPSPAVHIELVRPGTIGPDHDDTLDLLPRSVADVIASLRALAG